MEGSIIQPDGHRSHVDQRVVPAVHSGVLIAGDGAHFIEPGLIGEVDGKQFRLQMTDAQIAASDEAKERTILAAAEADADGRHMDIGGGYPGIEGSVGHLGLLVDVAAA